MKNPFSWQYTDYQYSRLKRGIKYTAEQQYTEYKILYKRAKNRLYKLEKAGFGETKLYKDWINRLPSPSSVKGKPGKLAGALVDSVNFLIHKTTTVAGMKKAIARSQKAFSDMLGRDIGSEEFVDITKFMDILRKFLTAAEYDSMRAVEVYDFMEEHKIPMSEQNILKWYRDFELLKEDYMKQNKEKQDNWMVHRKATE